jgi:hypothetical protein
MADLAEMEDLADVRLDSCVTPGLRLPPSVKTVELMVCSFADTGQPITKQDPHLFAALNQLESLKLTDFSDYDYLVYPQVIYEAASKSKPGALKNLCLGRLQSWPGEFTKLMQSPWFREVKNLDIYDARLLKDEHSLVLCASCPNIESLYISEAAVTGVFLADLIRAPGCKLRKVTLSECFRVSKDVVSWAKARGVHVDLLPNRSNSGINGNGLRVREE